MHLDAHLAGVEYGGKVGGDDGVDALGLGTVDDAAHNLHLGIVNYDVHREVGLDTCGVCRAYNLGKVVESEVHRRRSTHIELLDTEIYRVGTGGNSSIERLVRAYGRHNLYITSSNHSHYFLRPIRLRANSARCTVRSAPIERLSRMPKARSKRWSICCSVARLTSNLS